MTLRGLKGVLLVGLVFAACSGGSKSAPGVPCLVNSDCTNPLSCSYGKCHASCAAARDCPTGQLCVLAPIGAVCQLPVEVLCHYRSDCTTPLTCALDRHCRSECQADIDCPTRTQTCVLPDKVCAEPNEIDPATMGLKGASSTPVPDAPDGGVRDGGGDGAGGGDSGGNSCPSAQTQFGFIAQGDANPFFTSGVGVRTANQLLIFSAYSGPVPAGFDGGAGVAGVTDGGYDGGLPTVNLVYVQAFNGTTAKSLGPATVLFQAANGPQFTVDDVSIAPTGEIALLHSQGAVGASLWQNALYATFFTTTSDPGAAGVQLVGTVQIESAVLEVTFTGVANFPRATWSAVSKAFVFSWEYGGATEFVTGTGGLLGAIKVRKFLPTGQGAGGDTNNVIGLAYAYGHDQGAVGTSGNLFGVVSADNNTNGQFSRPLLTVLDALGGQVGGTIGLKNDVMTWVTVGGTASGFVGLYGNAGTVTEVFVPTSGDPTDAGLVLPPTDGGAPGEFAGFSFSSSARAAHAISDDTGGAGGVGIVLLDSGGASLLYVKSDGVSHVGPGTVISSASGGEVAISNYHGSFAVSLYDGATHATQVAASGCGP